MVAIVLGEGMSGGAIGIAAANKVYMLEHATYAVISPEGCASILWRDSAKAEDAATAMKITAQDCEKFGIIDGIIDEPIGGAHRAPKEMIESTGKVLDAALKSMSNLTGDELRKERHEKFLAMGREGIG
jgi:acetyl-CoA carboxylase carboxyl transferase subunit alpha